MRCLVCNKVYEDSLNHPCFSPGAAPVPNGEQRATQLTKRELASMCFLAAFLAASIPVGGTTSRLDVARVACRWADAWLEALDEDEG